MLPGSNDSIADEQTLAASQVQAMQRKCIQSVIRTLGKIGARYKAPGPTVADRAVYIVREFTEQPAPRDTAPATRAKADAKIDPSKTDLPSDARTRNVKNGARRSGPVSDANQNFSGVGYTPAMPIPRLHIEDAALLVIDVQEKLIPTIVDADKIMHNCATLVRLAEILELPYLITEQYPTGLGRTVETITAAMEDQSRRIEKTSFSAAVDIVLEQLHAWRRGSVIIAGLEAHVCVLQSVLDLQAGGRQCFVCTDAVSASQRDQIPFAYRRMDRAGAVLTGVLPATYELLRDSTHPAFKPCLELARTVLQ